jgi:hypothetical protein
VRNRIRGTKTNRLIGLWRDKWFGWIWFVHIRESALGDLSWIGTRDYLWWEVLSFPFVSMTIQWLSLSRIAEGIPSISSTEPGTDWLMRTIFRFVGINCSRMMLGLTMRGFWDQWATRGTIYPMAVILWRFKSPNHPMPAEITFLSSNINSEIIEKVKGIHFIEKQSS